MKKYFTKLLTLCLCITTFASFFTGCTPKTDTVNTYDGNGISIQAMELIQFYCDHRKSLDYSVADNTSFAFAFLNEKGLLSKEYKTENTDSYTVTYGRLMDVYQFLHAGKLPAGWWTAPSTYADKQWTTDYIVYNCRLEFISLEQSDETHFTAIFDRYYNDELYDRISFTMEKQAVEELPEILKKEYKSIPELWRIKSAVEVIPEFSETPRIVEIYTVADFKAATKEINTYGDLCNQKLYVLKADINFNGAEITPIGTKDETKTNGVQTAAGGFGAKFDGNGHTLSNFTISYDGGYFYAGLFSRITAGGTVQNLNIENAVVKPSGDKTFSGAKGSGLLAGYCNGAIKNCSASGTVIGGEKTGGLVGHLYGLNEDGAKYNNQLSYGVIKDCTVNADVSGYSEVGNFAGMIHYGYIEKSTAKGSITASKKPNAVNEVNPSPFRIGGFIGTSIGCHVYDCDTSTSLTINDTPKHVGAFSATCESSSFYNCTYDSSKVSGVKTVSYVGVNSSVGVKAK